MQSVKRSEADIWASQEWSEPLVFLTYFQMEAPQRRALAPHLNYQKSSDTDGVL